MRQGYGIAVGGLIALIAFLGGCAASSSSVNGVAIEQGDPLAPLLKLEHRFDSRPSDSAQVAPAPPSLPKRLLSTLGPEAQELAAMPLSEVLSLPRFAELPGQGARSNDPDSPLDEEEATEAVRAYVLGRASRLEGDLDQAEEELRLAVQLDPGASPAWRELAEVLLAKGDRPRAASAFRRALSDEGDDPRALEYLSTDAFERGAYDEAIAYLAHLYQTGSGAFDPALPTIVAARLGEALFELGYLRAGSQALREALERPAQFGQPTNYAQEFATVFRRRASLWVSIGDASLQQGDAASAFNAYDRAQALPGGESSGLLARRVWAEMSRGNPAAAARWVLLSLARAQGAVDRDAMDLLRHITQHSDIGPEVGRVIAALGDAESEADRPRVARALVLAGATVADDAQAVEILRSWIARAPADDVAVRLLIDRAADVSYDEAIAQTTLLVEQAPLELERYIRVLTGADRAPSALLELFESPDESTQPTSALSLVEARLLMMRARLDEALDVLMPIAASPTTLEGAMAAGLVTRNFSLQARWNDADEFAESLAAQETPFARFASALSFGTIDRDPEALEHLLAARAAQELWSDAASAGMAMLEAHLRTTLQDTDQASQLLEELILSDPLRSDAYMLLLQLATTRSGPAGQQSDRAGLVLEAIARLDADNPVRRWLDARSTLSTARAMGMLDEVRDLERAYPGQPLVLELLGRIWIDAGTEDALDWFEKRYEERPGESAYALGAARILQNLRRFDAQRDLLGDVWERTPGDRTVSVAYEALLRNRAAHRDRRAYDIYAMRIDRAHPVPGVLREKAEHALTVRKDYEAAARWFEELFALDRPIPTDTLTWAEGVIVTLTNESRIQDPDSLVRMHRAFFSALIRPTFDQLNFAAQLLAATGQPTSEILELARESGRRFPDQAGTIYYITGIQALNDRDADRVDAARESISIAREGLSSCTDQHAALQFVWLVAGRQLALQEDDYTEVSLVLHRAFAEQTYEELLARWASLLGGRNARITPAEAAANLGGLIARSDDHALAKKLYLDAAERDPNHVNARNNLGYQLLEWGEDLEEAEALIEDAYQLAETQFPVESTRAFVTDSLGWARYKLGIMHDVVDENGSIIKEGAIRVLNRAVTRARADSRPESQPTIPIVKDHLADALWAAGDHSGALEEWGETVRESERIANDQQIVAEVQRRGGDLQEMLDAAESAQRKLEAAREDREPEIAPVFRPVNDPAPLPAAEQSADARDADRDLP